MNILNVLFFATFLVPIFSAPDLSQAIARISEARARAVANRERIRSNSGRISSHIRSSGRPKRQYGPGFDPPPPIYEEEPELVHICSVEDDAYAPRSAENSDEDPVFLNHENPTLDEALEDLTEAQINLRKFQEEVQNLNSSEDVRDAGPHLHSHLHSHQHTVIKSHGHHQFPIQSQILTPGYHHLPSQILTPGLNLNINQNQQLHNLHQPTSSFINQGVVPSINHLSPNQNTIIANQNQALFQRFSHQSPNQLNVHHELKTNFEHHQPLIHHSLKDPMLESKDLEENKLDEEEETSREAKPTIKKLKRKKMQMQHYPSYGGYPQTYGKFGYRDNEDSEDEDEPSSGEVEARTIKKLKRKKMMQNYQVYPVYQPQPQQHYNRYYPQYREEEEDEDLDSLEREASPTIKKLKRKKMQKFYQQPHYSQYRNEESEEDDEDNKEDGDDNDDEEREASPTIKKLKRKKMQKLYYQPQYHQPQYHQIYRESEDFFPESEEREANPTIKKLKMKKMQKLYPQYSPYSQPQYYRESEDLRMTEEDPSFSSFLINVPKRRKFSDQYKRSLDQHLDQLLGQQREIAKSLEEKSKNDEDLKLVADITNRTLTTVEERRRKVVKRSLPLTRLISDPKVKLDVPKTIENFGTATRNAFEDERAPMYHLKHVMGSSKNALLSAMRIPPQNMIIPTEYEIVKSSEIPTSSNPASDDPFVQTFRRVGEMVRESIKSGQETANHIGEAAHSARNVLHTARHSAPRLIIPYSQIPALQRSRSSRPNKAILITPRIVDLSQEPTLGHPSLDSRPNFVKLGHLMDAVGISNPNTKDLELQKIIFEPRRIHSAKVDSKLANLYSKLRNHYDDDVDTVSEAISTLEDAKLSVGAKNLRDFLLKMKNELTNFVTHKPMQHKKPHYKKKKSKKQETKEMGKFIETLFDGTTKETQNETVGDGLNLSPELMHPFMGRASPSELKNFLRENGGDSDRRNHLDNHQSQADLGYVLGAINPLMFERMYNQTIEAKADKVDEDLLRRNGDDNDNSTLGNFALTDQLKKPFMGQARPQQIQEMLDTYNKDDDYGDYNEMDE